MVPWSIHTSCQNTVLLPFPTLMFLSYLNSGHRFLMLLQTDTPHVFLVGLVHDGQISPYTIKLAPLGWTSIATSSTNFYCVFRDSQFLVSPIILWLISDLQLTRLKDSCPWYHTVKYPFYQFFVQTLIGSLFILYRERERRHKISG